MPRTFASHPIQKRQQAGFTLVDILWAIAIFSLLIVIGIPAMNNTVGKYKAREAFNSFRSAIAFAKAEAIIRRKTIVVCPRQSATGYNCDSSTINSVDSESSAWKKGWLVFVAANDTYNNVNGNDIVLKAFEGSKQAELTIEKCGSTRLPYIQLSSKGISNPTSFSVRFHLTDSGSNTVYKDKIYVKSGRLRLARNDAERDC